MLHLDVAALAVSAPFTTSTLELATSVGLQVLLASLGPYPVTVPVFTGGSTSRALLAVPGFQEVPFHGLKCLGAGPRTAVATIFVWDANP